MKQILSSGLLFVDLVSEKPEIYYKGNARFSNYLGSFLSILVLMLGFSALISFSLEIIQRQTPEIVMTQEYMKSPQLLFDEHKFFAFGIMKADAVVIQDMDKKMDVYLAYTISDGANKEDPVIDTRIELISCQNSKRFHVLNKKLGNADNLFYNPRVNYFCLPDELPNPIQNSWGDPYFLTYKVFAYLKYIDGDLIKELELMYLHTLSTDFYFDGNKIDQPAQMSINSQLIVSGIEVYKDLNIYYQLVDYTTDYGYVFEEKKTLNTYILNKIALDTNLRTSENMLFYMKLTLLNVKQNYKRRYTKLQTTLANVGGMIKFLLVSAQIISYLFRFIVFETIIDPIFRNEEFKYKEYRNIIRGELGSQIHSFKRNEIHFTADKFIDDNKNKMVTNTAMLNETHNNLININDKKRNSTIKKSKDGICKKLFCRSKDINLIIDKYKKSLSFAKLIQLQQDVYKIKKVLLNEHQEVLFKVTNGNIKTKKRLLDKQMVRDAYLHTSRSNEDKIGNNLMKLLKQLYQ